MPVQTFEVEDFLISDASNASKLIKSIPGLSLKLDPNELEDNDKAMQIISDVISRLKSNG